MKVLMPFSESIFFKMGRQQMADVLNIYEPKKFMKNTLKKLTNRIALPELKVSRSQIKFGENNEKQYAQSVRDALDKFLKELL